MATPSVQPAPMTAVVVAPPPIAYQTVGVPLMATATTETVDYRPSKMPRYGDATLARSSEKETRPNRVGINYRCGRCGMPKKGHVCDMPKDAPKRSRQPARKMPAMYNATMYTAAPDGVVRASVVLPGQTAAPKAEPPPPPPPPVDPSTIVLEGIEGVRGVLTRLKLEQYTEQFEAQGFDELTHLLTLDHDGLLSVAEACSLKPGHALRFIDMFDAEARALITLAGYVITEHQ